MRDRGLAPPQENEGALAGAASTWGALATDAGTDQRGVARGIETALDSWTGPRSVTFLRGGAGVQVQLRTAEHVAAEVAETLADYARAVRDADETIADCERRHRQAVADYEAASSVAPFPLGGNDPFAIGADADAAREATRDAEHWLELAEEAHRTLERKAAGFASRLDALLARLTKQGHSLPPAARRVHGHGAGAGGSGVLASLDLLGGAAAMVPEYAVNSDGSVDWVDLAHPPRIPAAHAEPAKVNTWWQSLSADQRAWLVREHPTRLGNLDGLPAFVRDAANRASIPLYRARLAQQLEDLKASWVPSLGTPLELTMRDTAREQLQGKLDALNTVETLVRRGGRQLLVLDPFSGRRLHAAVAIGNVDTADHVTVYTPGFTTTVQDSLRGYVSDMQDLKQVADEAHAKVGDGSSVAAVAWLGYDTPQWSEVTDPARSVGMTRLAKKGGDSLAGFLKGINASRPDPHLTVLGHSYGSLTTGYALQHRGLGVDDAVLFGSPGLGTWHRKDLHVPRGHLHLAEAALDPVADLGGTAPFGADPSHLSGVDFLQTGAARSPLDGHQLNRSLGHTAYLDDQTTSQWNLAVVAAGLDPSYLVTTGRPPLFSHGHPTGDLLSELPYARHQAQDAVASGLHKAGGLAEDAVKGTIDAGESMLRAPVDLFHGLVNPPIPGWHP